MGGVFGVISVSWISLNAQWAIASGSFKFESKLTSVSECTYEFDDSVTSANATFIEEE